MKTLYLDCFAGISGDMFVGAMLNLGLPLQTLEDELAKLGFNNYRLEAKRVNKLGLQATHFKVVLQADGAEWLADTPHDHEHADGQHEPHQHGHSPAHTHDHAHRPLSAILALIDGSGLSAQVKRLARDVFTRLGEAEAAVHGIPVEQVHFHEVGAVDAIVDIVSAAIAVEYFGIDEVIASPVHLGSGLVKMSHGLYPIPAPATANLLAGVPVYSTEAKGELTTPTGAAIVRAFAKSFGPLPAMTLHKTGYGAGTKDRDFPNVLRAMLGEQDAPTRLFNTGQSIVIEANIDDMNPQHYEPLMAHLLASGALDVVLLPVLMKKQRPATLLQVIADPSAVEMLLQIIFRESTTIGARTYEVTRYMLPREIQTVQTAYGAVRVKLARMGDVVVNATPEYDDCRTLAEQTGAPIKYVTAAAQAAAALLQNL